MVEVHTQYYLASIYRNNSKKIRKPKVCKLAAIVPRHTQKNRFIGRLSNFGKDGPLGYCVWLYTPLEQCLTTVFVPDEVSEAMLRLEMSSDVEITAFLSWEFSSSAKHTNVSPILGFHASL